MTPKNRDKTKRDPNDTRIRSRGNAPPSCRLAAFVVLAIGTCALGTMQPEATPPKSDVLSVDPVKIPDPDMSEMQPGVAERIREARDAVRAAPKQAERWGHFGAMCDAHQLYPEAITCYRRARELAPQDSRWTYLLAVVLSIEGGDRNEIVALLKEFSRDKRKYAPAYVRLGRAYVELGKPKQAQNALARAVELNPKLAIGHYELAQVLLREGKVEAAIEHLEQAALLAPDDGLTQAALAQAFRRLGNLDRATELAESARALQPTLGLPDPLQQSVQNLSESSVAVRQRLEKFMKDGEYARAIPELVTYARAHPKSPYVQMLLALAYLRNDQPLEAEPHFIKAVEAKMAVRGSGGRDERMRKMVAQANKVLVVFCPEFLNKMVDLGDEKQLRKVAGRFQAAASVIPGTARLHVAMGRMRRATGHLDHAVKHYVKASKMQPKYAMPHYHLGVVAEDRDQADKAIEHYSRAVELDPKSPAAERLAALKPGPPNKP